MNPYLLAAALAAAFVVGAATGVLAYKSRGDLIALVRTPHIGVPSVRDYQERVAFLREFPVKADVLMVGDSITAMADWQMIFPDVSIANYGVGWDNTLGLLARLDPMEAVGARLIFLMIGSNDLFYSADVGSLAARHREIVSRLLATGAEVAVQSILMRSEPGLAQRALEVNRQLQADCEALPRCRYIDLNSILSTGERLRPEFALDSRHLTAAAYRAWAEQIGPIVCQSTPYQRLKVRG